MVFDLGKRVIGQGRPFIVAELAQAHDGSLGQAHAYIDAVADAGADAIKFQTHIAAAESTYDEPFRVKFSAQDATRYDYWRRMEFRAEEWGGLAKHASERGLVFLSSAFSPEAVELLRNLDMPAWKIASGELGSSHLLECMMEDDRPILVSSGMSSWSDLDRLISVLADHKKKFAVMQCTTKYPTPLEQVGLNVLAEMRERYDCPVGLSDHSGTVFPSLAVMSELADIVEVHVVFDKRMFGPDTCASIDIEELEFLCKSRDAFQVMHENPVDKDHFAAEFEEMRAMFGRSLALKRDLPAGTVLSVNDLTAKKPAGGIHQNQLDRVVGKKLARDVPASRLLREEDLFQ
ncbi:N-acetylneuraminate synthase family protein [uncultured Thalassospira sp.]|uniref:N-acetylneuraminate synthase family protein n=1 Tax=uncultured Thalassospira sp. TaxID=404382 RepID=UPI0025910995|nr:N-acetylneuraminate synthase family protein [uncultured Thalassospira sp.]